MNRRKFLTSLGALGLFNILPGAGRVWKAEKLVPVTERFISTPIDWRTFRSPYFESLPSFQDFLRRHPTYEEYMANPAAYLGMDIKAFRNKTEVGILTDVLSRPTIWPPNMGETKRLIIEQPISLVQPNFAVGDAQQLRRVGLV